MSGLIGAAGENVPLVVTTVFEVEREIAKIKINLATLDARKKRRSKWKNARIGLAAIGMTGRRGRAAARPVEVEFRRE